MSTEDIVSVINQEADRKDPSIRALYELVSVLLEPDSEESK